MKITLTELKQIIKEEILAEKKRRRILRRRKKQDLSMSKDFYPMHPYPYHMPPQENLDLSQDHSEDDDSDMDIDAIEIA